jgi:hypothetical protein
MTPPLWSVSTAPTAAPATRSPLSASAVLGYLRETLVAAPQALLFLGLKRSIKVGAALHAGLEHVPAGAPRLLAGRYLVHACFQLDTLVDALPDFARAHLVHQFVRECLAGARPLRALWREVLARGELSLGERMKTVLLLRDLERLVRSTEAALVSPERVRFFRERLSSLVTAVVEDMNLEARSRDTLSLLAPEYPAMGLSSLEVLWLLQGRPLEEIVSYRPLLGLAEQLARLEDDVLEMWRALKAGMSEEALEARVDRRNLILRHARNLHWPMRESLDEACRVAGRVEWRLEQELERVADRGLVAELRRVVTFFPSFADVLIGPHRIPPESRERPMATALAGGL